MKTSITKLTKAYNLIYGYHPVHYVVQRRPEIIRCLYFEDKHKHKALLSLAEHHNVNTSFCDKKHFGALMQQQQDAVHQGVLALCEPVGEQDINDLETLVNNGTHPLKLLVLDGVTDPHNLGACLRNAAAFAVDALIIPKNNTVKLNSTVIKVACGAAHIVPVIKVTNLVRTLNWLKTMDFTLLGTSEKAHLPISAYKKDTDAPVALVMGSEGKGLRQLTAKTCDQLLRIDLPGAIQSLNVSAATAVCLHSLFV